jgi:hypothetical protein
MTAVAPATSTLRKPSSPARVMTPSLVYPMKLKNVLDVSMPIRLTCSTGGPLF